MSTSFPETRMKLSPSRMKDFMQCPKMFYFKYILGFSSPSTVATAKGTLSHHVFENIFDFPKEERNSENATSLIPTLWRIMKDPFVDLATVDDSVEKNLREKMLHHSNAHPSTSQDYLRMKKTSDEYLNLLSDESAELEFIRSVEKAVLGWFKMEKPNLFDPTEREKYVFTELGKNVIHGYIDRFDEIISKDGSSKVYISDYKTGKMPSHRYLDDAFFPAYGLCCHT